ESSRLAGQQQWSEALGAALRGVDQLSHEEIDPGLTVQVRNAVRELEVVRELERIRADRSAWVEGGFDYRGASDRYATAFRALGVDVDQQAPADAAGQLKARPMILAALIPALDDWAICRRELSVHGGTDRIWRVLEAIDPDPWRQKVRHLLRKRDLKGLV